MRTTAWIIGDQLKPDISSLSDLKPDNCVVFMVESLEHAQRLPFHKQKLVLIWSAMRHFAEELRGLGYTVDYYKSAPDFSEALRKHIELYKPDRMRIMETAEYGLSNHLAEFIEKNGINAEITTNKVAINFVWVLITGFLVMFMQAGFTLVEVGMTRAKNAAQTAAMNLLVYPLGMLAFYICGFALMFGGRGDIAI